MKALLELVLKNLVFIDIETARVVKQLELDTPLFDSWEYKKSRDGLSNDDLIKSFEDEAALHPEFARIVCISVGRITGDKLTIRTYNQEDEKILLEKFCSDLEKVTDLIPKTVFCGHAVKGFDIPFILKRCIINQVRPHDLLDAGNLKPWELTTVDTKDIWKGTSFNPTSLINIAVALGIPSPKDDISGAQVGEVYWGEDPNRVERISRYCEKDVLTTANVVRRCRFEDLLEIAATPVKEEIKNQPIIKLLFDGGKFTPEHHLKLVEFGKSLPSSELDSMCVILDSVSSTAAGKKTNLTKAHVKKIKLECQKK